jgi:hypothetical protein
MTWSRKRLHFIVEAEMLRGRLKQVEMKVWGIGYIVELVKLIGEVGELLHSSTSIDLFYQRGESYPITNRVIQLQTDVLQLHMRDAFMVEERAILKQNLRYLK